MIDLDHFKRINDTLGHLAGDAVLVEIAARMKQVLRQSDHLARFGGEELVALLPDCPTRDATLVAERVRRSIARRPIETAAGAVEVTASIGVAVTADGREALDSLIARADRALYEAKAAGRDRAILASEGAIERIGAIQLGRCT
jgi:diguanylate cyclase (GGDEF)-like protein